jgi:hypothetical protein
MSGATGNSNEIEACAAIDRLSKIFEGVNDKDVCIYN